MSIHFVSTSVISSEDGIGFGKEEAIESEETRQTRLQQERAQNKPLFEQLQDNESKRQEEFELNKKLMFAPPKALDEDDVHYFQALETQRQEAMVSRAATEEKALEVFRAAQREQSNNSLVAAPISLAAAIQSKSSAKKHESENLLPVIVKKKKIDHGVGDSGASKSARNNSSSTGTGNQVDDTKKGSQQSSNISNAIADNVTTISTTSFSADTARSIPSSSVAAESSQQPSNKGNSDSAIGAMFSGYGSDSDSD